MINHIHFTEPGQRILRGNRALNSGIRRVWSPFYYDRSRSLVYAVYFGKIFTFTFGNGNGCMFLAEPDNINRQAPNLILRPTIPPRRMHLIVFSKSNPVNGGELNMQRNAAFLLASADIPAAIGDTVKVTFWGRKKADGDRIDSRNIFRGMRVLHISEVEFIANEWISYNCSEPDLIGMITIEYGTNHVIKHLLYGNKADEMQNIMDSIDPNRAQ